MHNGVGYGNPRFRDLIDIRCMEGVPRQGVICKSYRSEYFACFVSGPQGHNTIPHSICISMSLLLGSDS